MSDVDYIALAFEPHGNVTMRQLRRAALREREAKDVLAARLAEVEAERDEAVKLAYERIEKQNVETGKRVDLIHEREAFRAERDRLAQELEDAVKALVNLEWAVAPHYPTINDERVHVQMDKAREFLARFPVREGDET